MVKLKKLANMVCVHIQGRSHTVSVALLTDLMLTCLFVMFVSFCSHSLKSISLILCLYVNFMTALICKGVVT